MEQKRLGRGLNSLLPTDPAPQAPITVLPIGSIVPNRRQPREHIDEAQLEQLTDSIRKNGILQPIVVRRTEAGFEIIAGERRWRAAARAALKEVPVVVRENVSDGELLELALLENVQRVDLNPIEKARGYRRLIDEFGRTQDEIAKGVGQDRATIANTLRLLELPDEIQQAVQQSSISGGHARALLSIPDNAKRRMIFERAVRDELSVRDVERLASEHGAKRKPETRKRKNTVPVWVGELEARWRRRLGVRVELGLHGQRSRIVIHCSSLDDLERVTDLAVGLPGTPGREG